MTTLDLRRSGALGHVARVQGKRMDKVIDNYCSWCRDLVRTGESELWITLGQG